MPALNQQTNHCLSTQQLWLCREAKKCKAYDMYQLLARMITFRQNIGQLLAAVRKHLADASQPKVYNKLSVLLQHASRGIHANATASPQDLMIFIHGVLDGGLAGEEAAREAAQAEATAAVHTSSECSPLHAFDDCTSYIIMLHIMCIYCRITHVLQVAPVQPHFKMHIIILAMITLGDYASCWRQGVMNCRSGCSTRS